MKKIFTIIALISFSACLYAQTSNLNDTCSNGTLSINLNTPKTIYHKVNTAYLAVAAQASSTKHNSSQISLTKKSDVNPNIVGTYTDCYTATDPENLKVECCRTVVVQKDSSTASIAAQLEQSIIIYPNPVLGEHFKVKLGSNFISSQTTIHLIDINGREIQKLHYSVSANGFIDVSLQQGISKGLYLMIIKHENAVVVRKLNVE